MTEKLAQEYVRLVEEGWSPDLDEFLGRVPKELREPCRLRIEGLQEAATEAAEPDPEILEVDLIGMETVEEEAPPFIAAEAMGRTKEQALEVLDVDLGVDAAEEPVPAGPQRLTKEEALAMWDSQLRGE